MNKTTKRNEISNPSVKIVNHEFDNSSFISKLLLTIVQNKLSGRDQQLSIDDNVLKEAAYCLVEEYERIGEYMQTSTFISLSKMNLDDLKLIYEGLYEVLKKDTDGYPVINIPNTLNKLTRNRECIESVGLKLHDLSINNHSHIDRTLDIILILFSIKQEI